MNRFPESKNLPVNNKLTYVWRKPNLRIFWR